jgi:hypothetical protein
MSALLLRDSSTVDNPSIMQPTSAHKIHPGMCMVFHLMGLNGDPYFLVFVKGNVVISSMRAKRSIAPFQSKL